ncbi:5'-nucleotidase C-terminal domain-containing protein [Halpernia frigidisoli]|uniref:5'-nucleotidase, C-terminal domain n=1 Tax=Halpernia frigidisoli TaxID=1125876 RepID=A0A1I3FBX9_9FLAO|nr:5'-nucleotidase [Halpernia frigidisoli]SFI08736.1 5'-nucleotidase, C-terminal domain [Halpernia frigidisoli]
MKSKIFLFVFSAFIITSCTSRINIANVEAQKNQVISSDLKDDPTFDKVIAPYKDKLAQTMNSVISHTNADLTKSGDNSNLGNLLADYTFEGASEWAKKNNKPAVDAAVINIGGIRSTIGKGDVLLRHVYEVMPFENEVMIVKLKGSDLQGLFDYYATTQKNNPVSHLYIETDAGKITAETINDEKITAEKEYYIATSDYLALGGDSMNFFKKGEMISTGIKLRDLFIQKFKANPEISAPNDVRILFKNKKATENE